MKKMFPLVMVLLLMLSMASCGSPSATTAPTTAPTAATTDSAAATESPLEGPDALVATFQEIHVETLGHLATSPRKPVEDRLTPIWRAKTKVIPDIVEIPAGQDYTAWLQMQIMGNTVPAVIAQQNDIMENAERVNMLKSAGMLREIKLEDMKKYMPRTAERLKDLGVTMEEWYSAMVDPSDGKLWGIGMLPSPLLKEEYRNTPYGEQRLGNGGYAVWMRDDILKKVFPSTMSAAELKDKAVANGNKLPLEQIMDVPIHDLDQFYAYLKAVKDLNLEEDGHKIIPGHPQFDNSRGALWWSLFSATGLSMSYAYPNVINEKTGTTVDYQLTPEWKAYIAFMNKCFNEGLLGEEFYTQKSEQREAKVINGEYAVVNMWHPVSANRDKAKSEGKTYDWRYIPIFDKPLNTDFQDAANQYFQLSVRWNTKGFNAKKITEEMMPQILNWIDWQYSYEAEELRRWGTPDMYTGDGMDRRFKPEYKKVEESLLLGKADETGDAWYYGIAGQDGTMTSHEVYGFTMADEMSYVYAPRYVYPQGPENYSPDGLVNTAWQQRNLKSMSLFIEGPVDDATRAAKAEYDAAGAKVTEVLAPYNDQLDNLIVKAITSPVADFEKNYKAYTGILSQPEIVAANEEMLAKWKTYNDMRQKFMKKIN